MCKSEYSVVTQPTESIFCRDSSYAVHKDGVYEDEKIILRKKYIKQVIQKLANNVKQKTKKKADDMLTKWETERKKTVTECHWTLINM